jgi:pimeloyl-ACP methyl ester carboxylesterase
MRGVQLTDCTIYYTYKKSQSTIYPPLVLIHGAGATHLDWPPQLRRLPDMPILALDLPGHGRSTGLGRAVTLAYAHDVCALLDALHIRRAIFAGHSMGGAIAQQIGIHMPERAAGLILLGTGAKLPVEPTLPQRIIENTEEAVNWVVEWSWGVDGPPEMKALGRERLLHMRPEVLRGDYLACQAFDVRDQIERIAAPTLVLAAREDRMVKLKFSETLSERIPNATLVVIEGAGHMFPLEKPQEVAEAVAHWLREHTW